MLSKKCNFCKRIGHFSKCCLKKKSKSINNIVRTNKYSTESEDEEQFFIGSIEDDLTFSEDTKWCIDLDTASTIIKYKIWSTSKYITCQIL